MKTEIVTPVDLSARILELKSKIHQQEEDIKNQFSEAMHSISPGNLIKSGFKKLTELPVSAPDLISSGLNMGANILSNKLLGSSNNTVKTIAAQALNYGANAILGEKAEKVKVYTNVILNRLIRGNKTSKKLVM